ncbi:MAG: MFS transporter [Gammaproteobacteria bacterium]|nr:MFS transporter [Gammaproteobacteria bacterium]
MSEGTVSMPTTPGSPAASGTATQTRAAMTLRWVFLALVVAGNTINYVDREIIALLKPLLETQLHWTDLDYGRVVSAFQFASIVAYLGAGWFLDWVGLRIGYPIAVGVWSLFAMLNAAVRSVAGFTGIRVLLGVAEAGQTPAAVKTIAAWFSQRERALALGFMNVGSNLGTIITPLIVPPLAIAFGWRASFLITGGLGFLWVIGWFAAYRALPAALHPHQRVAASAAPAARAPRWSALLVDRRAWAVAGAKFLSDAVWWFLLFWLPDFLHREYGLNLQTFGPPLAVIYALASVGALFGGVLPARMLSRGASLNAARKTTLLLCAVTVVPVVFVLKIHNYWYAVLLVGTVLAAHQGFSTNVFALAADLFPEEAVGSVIGLGALLGNLGGLAILELTAQVLVRTGSYLPMFIYCACAYLLALLVVQLLVPRIESPARPAGL